AAAPAVGLDRRPGRAGAAPGDVPGVVGPPCAGRAVMTSRSAADVPRGARGEVLARIRQANAVAARDPGRPPQRQSGEPAQAGERPRAGYRTGGDRGPAELLDLLADRLTDYRATVRRTTAAGLSAEVTAALAERGARRLVVP